MTGRTGRGERGWERRCAWWFLLFVKVVKLLRSLHEPYLGSNYTLRVCGVTGVVMPNVQRESLSA